MSAATGTAPPSSLVLRSWKAHFDERRLRLVPRQGAGGEPFDGPGIDVLGPELEGVLVALDPVRAWIEAREIGAFVRSMSFDFDRGRALATLRFDEPAKRQVHALRVDEAESTALFDLARAASDVLGRAAAVVLARRKVHPTRV